MEKKYFWDEFSETSKNNFNTWVLGEKEHFSLVSLYWGYIDGISKIKVDDNNVKEVWKNKEYHEKFLSYLAELLKSGKIKMRILEDNGEIKTEESGNRCIYGKIENPKDFGKENYKEGLKLLKEEWNNINDDLIRRHFEDMLVLFSLPENDFIY